jgi:rhodanese-related sulfurtransferase
MSLIAICVLIAVCAISLFVLISVVVRVKRRRDRRELERHSIEPAALYALLAAKQDVLVMDVRLPLDLLAFPEIIPGAKRIAPKEVLEQTSLIPKDRDTVVYCTCASERTSRSILRQALALNWTRIKFLKGGLAGWKAQGYPVERYVASFQLDTAS